MYIYIYIYIYMCVCIGFAIGPRDSRSKCAFGKERSELVISDWLPLPDYIYLSIYL